MGGPSPLLLIANPENRRAKLFLAAAKRMRYPVAGIVAHETLLDDPDALAVFRGQRLCVRIDSPGENAAVEVQLLALGVDEAARAGVSVVTPSQIDLGALAKGALMAPRQRHFGWRRYLRRLRAMGEEEPFWRFLTGPREIETLFDKDATAEMFAGEGLRVTEAIPVDAAASSVHIPSVHDALRQTGHRSFFVKLTCASSASGLAVLRYGPRGPRLHTTMRRVGRHYFNSLRVQRVSDGEAVDRLLSFLLREGARIEPEYRKVRLEGHFVDLRVLVVDGRADFAVVRASRHPITNLHLGGKRGDLDALQSRVGQDYDRALRECEKAAKAMGAFQLGLDVLFEPGAGHRIIEANAFGDLLPGLQCEGLGPYERQLQQLARA